MQKEIRLTDEEWSLVMGCLATNQTPEMRQVQVRILTQLRCHEAIQTMAPACSMEGEKHGKKT